MAYKINLSKIFQVKLFPKVIYRSIKEDKVREQLLHPTKLTCVKKHRKVSIIGASGNVGSTCANNFILKRICDEIVLVDSMDRKDRLCGEALDFSHYSSIGNHPHVKICFDSNYTKDSDLIIVCCGQKSVNDFSEEILHANADIFKHTIPKLAALSKDAVLLVVSDPVDIMTYAAWKYSGFDKNRVIGTGTELDSSRFRYLIGKRLGISPKSINAWVIGEHGKNCVLCWSSVDVAGVRLQEINPNVGAKNDNDKWYSLNEQVSEAEAVLRNLKGNCKWSISAIIENLAESILFNARNVHAVSTNCSGMYGVDSDTFLSLPVILGNRGVAQIVKQTLSSFELSSLQESAKYLNCLKKSIVW